MDRNYHGPFRLLGAAGTGKTVVAMHRAKRLAARLVRFGSAQKVLFTTYSVNLATDIRSNLKLICTPDEFAKIDVVNLDKLVFRYLRDKGYAESIWYDDGDSRNELVEMWRKAKMSVDAPVIADFDTSFFKDEWSKVIVPQRVHTVAEYLHTLRKGRGARLNRAQKVAVWQVVEAYQRLMRKRNVCDVDMAMQNAAELKSRETGSKTYAHVIVDEDRTSPFRRIV